MPDETTLTDIYDRLRRIRRPRPRHIAGLVVAAVALAACTLPPGPEERVCGTTTRPPIRVVDGDCGRPGLAVRWYQADPDELDYDDRTEVGEVLDDDYLGDEDDAGVEVPVLVPVPTSKPKPKPTPKPTAKPKPTATPRS